MIPCDDLGPFFHQIIQRHASPGFEHHFEMPLEIRGFKANLKYERKMDKRYKKMLAILFIQRVYRGFRTRKIVKALIQKQEALESLVKKVAFNLKRADERNINLIAGFETIKLCYLT